MKSRPVWTPIIGLADWEMYFGRHENIDCSSGERLAMDRNTFLGQSDVRGFIDWLCIALPNLDVHLRFRPSQFVKGGLNKKVVGIHNVHALYCWGSGWKDYQTGKWMASADWPSTKASLDLLRHRLATALASQCDATTYDACRAVLQWGGVRGAVPFLGQLRQQGKLVHYLESCRPLFSLTTGQKLSQLNSSSILRFDAGLTKIHSLIDTTGSPIYDSRVGAAIAMLYALYRARAKVPAQLSFPTGAARGAQIRDPGGLGYSRAPQFFSSSVSAHGWARSQLELGWIIQETLIQAPTLFSGGLPERCHAFEAALFMIGYDLRCLMVAPVLPSIATSVPSADLPHAKHAGGGLRTSWVPTSVPFPQILLDYYECSKSLGHAAEMTEFIQWQIQVKSRKPSTARAYCAPLRSNEFDLASFSLADLDLIACGGAKGLKVLSAGATEFVSGDEWEQVYLASIYLCGRASETASKHSVSPADLLMRAGFAGKASTAKLIMRIGEALGQHFDLLVDARPTAQFEAFFGKTLSDLDDDLYGALSVWKTVLSVVDEVDDLEPSAEIVGML